MQPRLAIRDLQRIVDLDTEIPNCAFELGVPEHKRHAFAR